MARKFLYLIAVLIVVVFAGRLVLQFYPEQLSQAAFVPKGQFEPLSPPGRYDQPAAWIARPGISGDPAHWSPVGAPPPAAVRAAVFFVAPTSYLARDHWNAPEHDPTIDARTAMFVRGLASPFAGAEQLWVPRYRQAAFGAFLSDAPAASAALDAAYADVDAAFSAFVAAIPRDLPIVLVGHSQGAFHLRRLIASRIAGTALAPRIAAAYLVGWPLSAEHDLPRLGLPQCATPDQPGCIASWMSFGDPADPALLLHAAERRRGLDGAALSQSRALCFNPLTGSQDGSAPAVANNGTLVPDAQLTSATLRPGLTGAHCRSDGLLHLDGAPELGPFVLPGNNYHVYDIPLFWADLRSDYARRVAAWRQ